MLTVHVTLTGQLGNDPKAAGPTSYWKLNVTALQDPDFLPQFTDMWQHLHQAKLPGSCPALWWEEVAKPACRNFCISFSKMAAHRRREKAFFLQRSLQLAVEAGRWAEAQQLKALLAREADFLTAGWAVRFWTSQLES
jgi:hypothetical protein